jgi:biotin transport system substrate-specific component
MNEKRIARPYKTLLARLSIRRWRWRGSEIGAEQRSVRANAAVNQRLNRVYERHRSMATTSESVDLVGDEVTRNVARAAVFAAATSATAPVEFVHPLVPNVPITLQTLWVYLSGVVLGPVWAGAAFVLYATAGVVGLPVFAGGNGGLGAVLGPTGGFIVGFPLAAATVGLLAHGRGDLLSPSDIGVPRLMAALVAGSVVVYAAGAVGFSVTQSVGLATAVASVVVPFVPVAVVKVAATVAIANSDAIVAR